MSLQQKPEESGGVGENVVVAVKASKEIPKAALVWALTHVVQPGDCITLLVVVPSQSSGRKWGFPRFAGDCASGHRRSYSASSSEHKSDITDSCSQMILQLHDVYDPNKINVKIKIVSGSPCGAVAAEAKRTQASWVVFDKQLRHEEKRCMEELQCNIVIMKHSQPKVLRLNLVGSSNRVSEEPCALPSEPHEAAKKHFKNKNDQLNTIRAPVVTPTSSPELGPSFSTTEAGTSSVSSSDPGTSPFFISEFNGELKKEETLVTKAKNGVEDSSSDAESENLGSSSRSLRFQPWMGEILHSYQHSSQYAEEMSQRFNDKTKTSTARTLLGKFSKLDLDAGIGRMNSSNELDYSGNVREAISLSRKALPGPPPLCSICQHKAPVFGKPPRWFSYAELELATGGFSQANFLAEGGFGSVHGGVLPDGLAVAVKQHKLASSQGDLEFCSEVEVLSCAQHRNVVMLIGFCIEDGRRLLVYEYICNGSLNSHLYGRQRDPLEWSARQKIAVGAARGLRYLHEECRVGCIVHRDMRPNNILLTHDFEPLVGDFGLARWQPDGDTGVETRVIGTFGYLAPEYAQSGQITEKADVYSFGVVLVELVTGRKAVDLNRPKGQQCLTEWARPLLEEFAIDELVDPRLGNCYSENEVVRILEGDMVMDSNYMSTPGSRYDVGNRSGRIWTEQQHQNYSSSVFNSASDLSSGKLSAFWEREKGRRISSEHDL
ncbi:Serine-threonine/tyrosine-protein kinase, catalytic domain [Dillenia turbinata]|uniref:Serine-threonine/tyrosine-protein kinase, catalytic domain n=1 Tax=Dillenia turbinata TaxID=194707 RepID=A0AAN8U7Y5_9MAGN